MSDMPEAKFCPVCGGQRCVDTGPPERVWGMRFQSWLCPDCGWNFSIDERSDG